LDDLRRAAFGIQPVALYSGPAAAVRQYHLNHIHSCTAVDSYLEASSREAGTAAELAASNNVVKYAGLSSQGEFVPIAVESHGPVNRDALQFLSELGSWRLVEARGVNLR